MFDNYFLASSNQMKLCITDYIFPIKQDNICDYNPLCFMSSGLMLDDIIMNIFIDSTKESTKPLQKHFFRFQDDTIHSYKVLIEGFTWNRKNADTKRTLCSHHFIVIKKLRRYISGILYIENDKVDLGGKWISSLMIKANLITHISLSKTSNLHPIYQQKNFSYHP